MSDYLKAIQLVAVLVRTAGITLIDACRISATHHGVNYDKLYREMTE